MNITPDYLQAKRLAMRAVYIVVLGLMLVACLVWARAGVILIGMYIALLLGRKFSKQ